jgi:putative tryptophan/tyrosine transport system substrate-binding protein
MRRTSAAPSTTRRREFITLLGGAVAAWPLAARAQQPMPVIGFLSGRSLASDSHLVASFRKGLSETAYVEGQNVAIEYRWAESRFDRLDVSVRTLRTTISITPTVFATDDPVELGLVANYNRPGSNATGG